MPTYEYKCQCGNHFEVILPIRNYADPQICSCGNVAVKQMSRVSVFVQPDICYDSPVDGRPITNRQARIEDLARTGCVEYDPGMRQDYNRRLRDSEAKLEATFDASVDEALESMPAREKEKLDAELQGGMVADVTRITPNAKTIETRIENV